MKQRLLLFFFCCGLGLSVQAQDYIITASGITFVPSNLTINVGETVLWDNVSGVHNVNGSLASYPSNPEGFFSGVPASAPWQFSHTFTVPGVYDYHCDLHLGVGMTGSITVVDNPPYPAYNIGTVTTVNGVGVTDSLDVVCEVTGIVHGGDFRGGTGVQFTIIDATSGIGVFDGGIDYYTVTEGDEVTIRGTVAQFNGLTQIAPDTIIFNSAGNQLNLPMQVVALNEATESELVRINDLTLVDPGQWTGTGSGFNVDVTDGINIYQMRIDNDVDLYSMSAPLGTFDLFGIGGQFDNSSPYISGYQIFPRSSADIIPTGDNPFVGFQMANAVVNEAAGTIEVPVLISQGNANPTHVTVLVSSASTAILGTDVTGTAMTTLTFPGGVVADTQFVSFDIVDDMNVESSEELVLALIDATNNASILPALGFYTLTIQDNDATVTSDLILTAVYDGPLSGGQPKGIELYVAQDIPDLSIFGVGSANNGQGSSGEEYSFPAVSATQGDYLFLTADSLAFVDFFGISPDFVDTGGSVNVNGNDAIELFENGIVIDVFGEINVDGVGQPWEYTDGWAYRKDATGPDGNTFVLNNWVFSGINALDGITMNNQAANPVPIETYSLNLPTQVNANNDFVTVNVNTSVDFDASANDVLPNAVGIYIILDNVNEGVLANLGNGNFSYTPDFGFCGEDSFTYEVCDNGINSCDTATVFITVNCPVDYPVYDIATVTTINASGTPDSLNVTCQIQGIVHGVDLQGNDNIQFYLHDGTGGISVFSANNFGYVVDEGDEVVVRGTIVTFNCLTQISPDTLFQVSSNNSLQTPTTVSTDLSEAQESELIIVENLTILDPGQWTNSGPGFNVDVSDGVNTYSLRIDNDVNIYGTPVPTYSFHAIGLGSQFDNDGTCNDGYQFLPRYLEDLIPLDNTTEEQLKQQIQIFPNPVSHTLQIQTDLILERITLSDVLGRRLGSWDQSVDRIEVADLKPGYYFISFTLEGATWTTQFVKQ